MMGSSVYSHHTFSPTVKTKQDKTNLILPGGPDEIIKINVLITAG